MEDKKDKEYLPLNDVSQRRYLEYLRWMRPLLKIPGFRAGASKILGTTKKLLFNSYNLLPGAVVSTYSMDATYSMAGLITDKNCDFMKDPEFLDGYAAAMRQQYLPTLLAWSVHVNQWAAFHAK